MNSNQIMPDLNARLVTLSDGRSGLRSGLQVEVCEPQSLNPEPATGLAPPRGSTLNTQPILDFIASDETLDRCDEVIQASGWRLDSYRRNPVFQNAHQYGDIIFTLGKALLTEVRGVGKSSDECRGVERKECRSEAFNARHSTPGTYLFQRVQFATDANPMARIAYGLYKGKFLNAVSVGFIPLRWDDGTGPEKASRIRRRYLEQELLEVSAVGIPANPNALQLGFKAGAIQKADLRELLELVETVLDSTVHGERTQNERSGVDTELLLALARDVRKVVKA